MTKWEIVRFPQQVTSTVCEQVFAFICQVEWGVPPIETAHLLGYKHLHPAEKPAEQGPANAREEERK